MTNVIRVSEVLAAEIMNQTWRGRGDPRTARPTGAGHGPDVTIYDGTTIVGLGELSVDDDPAIRQAHAELSRAGHTLGLPAGSGTWTVRARPHVHIKKVRRALGDAAATLAAQRVVDLWVEQEWVQRRASGPAEPTLLDWDDPLLPVCAALDDAGVVSLRSIPGATGDVAHVATVGGGSAGDDGAVLTDFVTQRMAVEPHASNVAKLSDAAGQRHVGIILGTATQQQRWDVYFPITHQGGFLHPPLTAPEVPPGVTDVWVLHITTGWAAWWTQDLGWTIHDGSEDWWRHQTHLDAVSDILTSRERA